LTSHRSIPNHTYHFLCYKFWRNKPSLGLHWGKKPTGWMPYPRTWGSTGEKFFLWRKRNRTRRISPSPCKPNNFPLDVLSPLCGITKNIMSRGPQVADMELRLHYQQCPFSQMEALITTTEVRIFIWNLRHQLASKMH
jgi:hypothetical protein